MANSVSNHPVTGESLNEAGRQNAKSVKTIIICALSLLNYACVNSAEDRKSASQTGVGHAVGQQLALAHQASADTHTGRPRTSADEAVFAAASCISKSAPAPIKTSLVSANHPVIVPANFLGAHGDMHAPVDQYGYVRNVHIEVDGLKERGFWANIETEPGVYDWSMVDQWVTANADHPIVWMIYGTPSFYQKYPGEASPWPEWQGIASPPNAVGYLALTHFAQAVKARYGSQIAAFEVWNKPSFPEPGNNASFEARWNPNMAAYSGTTQAPYFRGSASDLANIAFTLNNASLGVPILSARFANTEPPGMSAISRYLNAPVTLPGAHGQGKNNIQGLSTQFTADNVSPEKWLEQVNAYQAILRAAGVDQLPIWGTQSNKTHQADIRRNRKRTPRHLQRWVILAAAKRIRSVILTGDSPARPSEQHANPRHTHGFAGALTQVYPISGAVICNAALLADGRVWVDTARAKDFTI